VPPHVSTSPHPNHEADAPIDFARALQEFERDEALLWQVLAEFLKTSRRQLKAIQGPLAGDSLAEARIMAHSMKGGAGNLCAAPLGWVAARIEKLCEAGCGPEALQWLAVAQRELDALEAYLRSQPGAHRLGQA